jgi:hypothetical protein
MELFDYFKLAFRSISNQIHTWYDGLDINWNHKDHDRLMIEYSGLDTLLSDIGYNKSGLINHVSFPGIFSIKSSHRSSVYILDRASHQIAIKHDLYKMKFTLTIKFFIIRYDYIPILDQLAFITYPNDSLTFLVRNKNMPLHTYEVIDDDLISIKKDLDACINKLESDKIIRETGLGLDMDYKDLLKSLYKSIQDVKSNSLFYWGRPTMYDYGLAWLILSDEYILEKRDMKNNITTQTIVPGWHFSVDIATSTSK